MINSGTNIFREIRSAADKLLIDFYNEIPQRVEEDPFINESILKILITICNGKGNSSFSILNAVLWIFEYLRIFSN